MIVNQTNLITGNQNDICPPQNNLLNYSTAGVITRILDCGDTHNNSSPLILDFSQDLFQNSKEIFGSFALCRGIMNLDHIKLEKVQVGLEF